MGQAIVTDPAAVRRAMVEFRTLGQTGFLEKYGFGASRGWMLRDDDGRLYDAKAILGVAHGYQHPALGTLPYTEFHGGLPTARKLQELGLAVEEPIAARRNPVWSRDELILALDLYVRHRPSFPDDKHPEVVALSHFLNRLAVVIGTAGGERFRNANGVAMKLQNFRRFDPTQEGKGLPGGGKVKKRSGQFSPTMSSGCDLQQKALGRWFPPLRTLRNQSQKRRVKRLKREGS